MFCPGTGKTWNETKYFLKSIVMIHADLTYWWYLLHGYYWRNISSCSSVLNKAECELCGSQNQHEQGGSPALFGVWHTDFIRSLWQFKHSHLFRLIHMGVWCGKLVPDWRPGEKFLAHLQLNRNLPSPCLSSAAQHFPWDSSKLFLGGSAFLSMA